MSARRGWCVRAAHTAAHRAACCGPAKLLLPAHTSRCSRDTVLSATCAGGLALSGTAYIFLASNFALWTHNEVLVWSALRMCDIQAGRGHTERTNVEVRNARMLDLFICALRMQRRCSMFAQQKALRSHAGVPYSEFNGLIRRASILFKLSSQFQFGLARKGRLVASPPNRRRSI